MNHWSIDNVNYLRDKRNRDLSLPQLEDDDGNEIELPVKWGVCPTCDGEGKHVNPSIDCGGLSSEDFDDDPDFAENYKSGMYDVPCYGCGGRSTVKVIDEDRLSADVQKRLEAWYQAEADYRAEALMEARMGC